MRLPNETPRPAGEREQLDYLWITPPGWRRLSAVNNQVVGLWYIGLALLFFVMAGVLALLMRTQLAAGNLNLVTQDFYNQLFTMHGTTMMFLFAVPVVEAMGVLLLPQVLAARDLPFPRLSAFAIWAYAIGGLVFFSTIFYDLAPRGGWFMYPPLTLTEYSPGDSADFWLLGIGFIEISAIAGAIEIIVGALRTRPPGMTLARMPIFAWAMLIFAGMIVFAFPAVILATMLLEIERAFGWPIFSAGEGGDPLLWQHLFWFFGHPEVYIIFLPAAGLVSMIVPTAARTPLVGYHLIVVALVAVGFFSFGLWVHHMFATGIPALSLAFFSAASMAVAIPSGLQVFSWIATLAAGQRRPAMTPPFLFVMGFLVIFTIGGLSGVMVAMVPFDWQVHDTYFIVAHLHYVLIGGMVFPLFATFYHWAPMVNARRLSDRAGRWAFGLMFAGFNTAFLPMHWTGLQGMPRRVWTYDPALGWDTWNLVSTLGAYVMAAGVLVFLIDLLLHFRPGQRSEQNPWRAGTLEWLPTETYGARSIPFVTSREPLWDQPNLAADVEAGRYFLPNAPTGSRETLVTTPVDAAPDYVLRMPGNGWAHVIAAVFMAGFFLLLTVKAVTLAALCGAVSLVAILWWAWQLDPPVHRAPVDIGGGISLPAYMSGPRSHSWWAMVILALVCAALYLSYLFSYLYLWLGAPDVWAAGARLLPALEWPLVAGISMLGGAALVAIARSVLPAPGTRSLVVPALLAVGAAALGIGSAVEVWGHWQAGLRPTDSAYGAMVYMAGALSAQTVLAAMAMALFAAARALTGKLDSLRRVTIDNAGLLCTYAAGQAVVGLLLVHGFPRGVL